MSNDHLTPWVENEHITKPKDCGCVWRHAEYGEKNWVRCNYRKNAHSHSAANERHIYNAPSFRSPEGWVKAWLDMLGPTTWKRTGRVEKDSNPASLWEPGNDGKGTWTHAWDPSRGENFQRDRVPFWHNTHHVIACGEISNAFNEAERKLLLKTKWNINEMPNVIILPKQYTVARILKLPTHIPPDKRINHNDYSKRLGAKLNAVKAKLAKNANQTGHELTDQTAPAARTELEKGSAAIRKFLIQAGEKNPGINLDKLTLDSVDW